MAQTHAPSSPPPFTVAIIGAGITGVQLALGLLRRDIPVTLYEQAQELREIGAGIGFYTHIQECMKEIDPRIAEVLSRVGHVKERPFRFVDGRSADEDVRLRDRENLYDIEVPSPRGSALITCQRSVFLGEIVKLLPPGCLRLGRRLRAIEKQEKSGKVALIFDDDDDDDDDDNGEKSSSSSETHDAVIGCDGLNSQVRQTLLPPNDASAKSHYAHESAYRCLVDMERAAPALGPALSSFWTGRGYHVITYPVGSSEPGKKMYLNVAIFIRDPPESSSWPDDTKQVLPGKKQDIVHALRDSGPALRHLVDVLPEEGGGGMMMSRWGMFDSLDHPLSTYSFPGPVALAGDAAHASTPHHGIGAGMGVEDALVLCRLLGRAREHCLDDDDGRDSNNNNKATTTGTGVVVVLGRAFEAYDSARRERTQFVAASSRRQGELIKWEIPEITTAEEFEEDMRGRIERILDVDCEGVVGDALKVFEASLRQS